MRSISLKYLRVGYRFKKVGVCQVKCVSLLFYLANFTFVREKT